MFEIPAMSIFIIPIVAFLILLASAIRILREYERGVVFTLERFWGVKGPGLIILIPIVQQMVRVDLRTRFLDVPPQDAISRDNVSVQVNAVIYYRVMDPEKAILQVEDYNQATSELAQATAPLGRRPARARRVLLPRIACWIECIGLGVRRRTAALVGFRAAT